MAIDLMCLGDLSLSLCVSGLSGKRNQTKRTEGRGELKKKENRETDGGGGCLEDKLKVTDGEVKINTSLENKEMEYN